MKNYKVTGRIAVLGVGMVLKLSHSQASIRTSSLKQKSKDIYLVLAPVQFKQGEIIIVVDGNVSKSVLVNLEELSKKEVRQEKKANKTSNKKKNKNSDKSSSETAEDNGETEEEGNTSNPDGEDGSQPETEDGAVISNEDINDLPL